jgi:hypothetical protein
MGFLSALSGEGILCFDPVPTGHGPMHFVPTMSKDGVCVGCVMNADAPRGIDRAHIISDVLLIFCVR